MTIKTKSITVLQAPTKEKTVVDSYEANGQKVNFIHFRQFKKDEGICIGYSVNEAKTEAVVSMHLMRHNYSKRIGRLACTGRLEKGKTIEVALKEYINDDIIDAVCDFFNSRNQLRD